MGIRIRRSKTTPGVRFADYTTEDKGLDSPYSKRKVWIDDDVAPYIAPPKPEVEYVREWVPMGSVRATDPPLRKHFINNLPPHKSATALIRGYVESRVGCKDKAESEACQGFLRAWHAIEADGNEAGIDLAVMPANGNAVQFYFHIHGIGPMIKMPVLVTASNDRTAHIQRETSDHRVRIAPEFCPAVMPDEERTRRVPPKVDTVLFKRGVGR